MGWKDTIQPDTSPAVSWRDSIKSSDDHMNIGESALTGLANQIPGLSKLSAASLEPAGAAKALLSLLGANYDKDADVANYEKRKGQIKEVIAKAKSDNPLSYYGGAGAGLLAAGLATGGAGTLAEGASLGSKIASGAELGSLIGGGSALAESEGNSLGEKLGDTITGAGVGALTGGAVPAIGAGLGWAAKKALPKYVEAGAMGKAGEDIISQAGRRKIEDTGRAKVAGEIADKLSSYGDELKNAYKTLEDQFLNEKIDTKTFYEQAENLINTVRSPSDREGLLSLLNQNVKRNIPIGEAAVGELPEASYKDMLDLKREFSNLGPFGKTMSTDKGTNVAGKVAETIGGALEDRFPGLTQANEQSHNFLENVLKPLKLKGKDDRAAVNEIGNQLFRTEANTQIGSNTRNALNDAMTSLKEINPELASDLQSAIQSTAKKIQVSREAANTPFPTAGNPLHTIKGAGLQIANGAGQISRALTSLQTNTIGKLGKAMLTDNPSSKLGQILVGASERDEIGKNAVLFSLMSNPGFRNQIQSLFGMPTEHK